jgi:hypothetical protein
VSLLARLSDAAAGGAGAGRGAVAARIPILGPTNVYCDNEAVTKNAIYPESTLKKKHNSIAYHRTREAVAAGTIRVTKEDGKTNLADVLTKPLPQVTKEFLCNKFMY